MEAVKNLAEQSYLSENAGRFYTGSGYWQSGVSIGPPAFGPLRTTAPQSRHGRAFRADGG